MFAAGFCGGSGLTMDDLGEQESEAGKEKPLEIKAEDNPWYLLATLYGVSRQWDQELKDKNRVAWNRYFAANLDEETRTKLIKEKRHPAEELRPFSPEELQEVATAFARRRKVSANELALPESLAEIDFSNVEFEQYAFFQDYLFGSNSSFQRATFSDQAYFGGSTYSGWANFRGVTFSGGAGFSGAAFSFAWFEGATFSFVSFEGATFSNGADFGDATFSGGASFDGVSFSREALFGGATFSGEAHFGGATFSHLTSFGGATFSHLTSFDGATFSLVVDFRGTTFSHVADFHNAIFGEASSFVNAEMKGETSFEDAEFKTEPPRFFGAKLHQGTIWRGVEWPPLPKNRNEAGPFIDAYECLRLEMDSLKKHEDELEFIAREMQSRRVYLGPWRGLPFALYGLLSNYGRSYVRPLVALFIVAAIGAAALWYFDARTSWEALGLSAANTLNVFSFRRDFNLAMDTPLAWLKVFAALQTILGAILLFLVGLGIRNKFRMK
jgi:uncharacterized protein YjbI with pentapeptide repeats